VENIPDHIEETATIVIAITRNLFDSYWCALAPRTAAPRSPLDLP